MELGDGSDSWEGVGQWWMVPEMDGVGWLQVVLEQSRDTFDKPPIMTLRLMQHLPASGSARQRNLVLACLPFRFRFLLSILSAFGDHFVNILSLLKNLAQKLFWG